MRNFKTVQYLKLETSRFSAQHNSAKSFLWYNSPERLWTLQKTLLLSGVLFESERQERKGEGEREKKIGNRLKWHFGSVFPAKKSLIILLRFKCKGFSHHKSSQSENNGSRLSCWNDDSEVGCQLLPNLMMTLRQMERKREQNVIILTTPRQEAIH